jgi:pilus assembly protein TadC
MLLAVLFYLVCNFHGAVFSEGLFFLLSYFVFVDITYIYFFYLLLLHVSYLFFVVICSAVSSLVIELCIYEVHYMFFLFMLFLFKCFYLTFHLVNLNNYSWNVKSSILFSAIFALKLLKREPNR